MLDEVGEGRVSRALAAILAGIYIIGALAAGGVEKGLKVMLFCLVPWFCVWFPDAMGNYTGYIIGPVTKKSPAIMVWIMGWVVLLLPLIILFLLWAEGAFKYPPLNL